MRKGPTGPGASETVSVTIPIGEVGLECDLSVRAGGKDPQVLVVNDQSLRLLNERSQMDIVPGAKHLFEKQGTLDRVSERRLLGLIGI